MHTSDKKKYRGIPTLGTAFVVVLLCFSLISCAMMEEQAPPAAEIPNMKVEELVYGVSISVPQGWEVLGSARKGAASNADIEKALAEGKRPRLIDMIHPSSLTPEKMDARAAISLAQASRENTLPLPDVLAATQEQFDQMAQRIISENNQRAEKDATNSKILEWRIYTDTINGLTALVQEGRGSTPSGGEMLSYSAFIYLPNGNGIIFQSMGDASIAGNKDLLKAISRTIRFEPSAQ